MKRRGVETAVEQKKHYIITSGLTKRLIDAYDEGGAREQFLIILRGASFHKDDVGFRRQFTLQPGEIEIHEATEAELSEFRPKRRTPKHEGQQSWPI